jgi:uracil-DNA glycosylase
VAGRRSADGSNMPLVAVLWGKDAESVRPLLGNAPVLASAHPSPLSASRGFFGSRPFSRANEILRSQGAEPVLWELPPVS